MPYSIVPATLEHGKQVLQDIRNDDIREAYAMGHRSHAALEKAIADHVGAPRRLWEMHHGNAAVSYAIVDGDGHALMVFGAIRLEWNKACAWSVTTNRAQTLGRTLQRRFEEAIGLLHSFRPRLVAYSHFMNTVHHDWMKALGFKMGKEFHEFTPGEYFLSFTREEDGRVL